MWYTQRRVRPYPSTQELSATSFLYGILWFPFFKKRGFRIKMPRYWAYCTNSDFMEICFSINVNAATLIPA